MEIEILKLIYDYSINGKLVDPKSIDKLIEIVVTGKSLNNYVQRITFTNQLDKDDYKITCAAYSVFDMEVIIDYESIQMLLEKTSYYDSLFNKLEQIMVRNFTITQTILHELEHAYQNKQSDNKSDCSIEAKLVRACWFLEQAIKNPKFLAAVYKGEISLQDFSIYVLKNRELYDQYYEFNPTERLAQVNSFRTIVNSIEPIKKHIPNLYEFEIASLMKQMLRGYPEASELDSCPTQVYLTAIGRDTV